MKKQTTAHSSKPLRKLASSKRAMEKPESYKQVKEKIFNEGYDRGFNDGYTKGLEDGALDNP